MTQSRYDPGNLQSLFGYGRAAHVRSGGICQLCGCGKDRLDFDVWRQFTIEHLIGEGAGGYPVRIRAALETKFGGRLPPEELIRLAHDIHESNVVTACHFCNSTTSRDRPTTPMDELIASGPDEPEQLYEEIKRRLQGILDRKREVVAWKLDSTRERFDRDIAPELEARRREDPALLEPWSMSGLDIEDTAPPQ